MVTTVKRGAKGNASGHLAGRATRAARIPRKTNTANGKSASKGKSEAKAGGDSLVLSLAKQLQTLTGTVLGNVGAASDVMMAVARNRVRRPGSKAAVEKAAGLLRDLREAAGLTVEDLGKLLELEDASFMDLVESGAVGLPFDLILRLATVLGRNDPVGFILQMTRTYNPKMWKALETLGLGKLLVQAGREREFANIYRRHGAAGNLSDEDFASALSFAEAAFANALAYQERYRKGRS
ncbi:MAG: helix-turn-helix domain-containing protein [Burkholderiaceae bacterium]|nr:helix-turn-helix domain-containing protein [Burkholderiaceae bacterium]